MSSEWEISELGKVAFNASRPFQFSDSERVVFVNTGDVLHGKFLHENLSESRGLPGQAKKALKNNDILLTEIRPENGRYAYVDFDVSKHVVSTKFMVIESLGRVSPRFLYHVITNSSALKEFQRIAESRSGTFPQITFESIAHYPIPVPPKEDQENLAKFLDEIDDRITLLRETNATLEAIAQALFKSWFVDFDPVHANKAVAQDEARTAPASDSAASRPPQANTAPHANTPNQVALDPATAALFSNSFQDSELGLIPEGWRVELAEKWLSVLETGRRPKGGVAGILNGVPSIGAESITRIGEFDYGKTKYVTAEFFEKMKSGELQSHDVLLYKDGGKPGVFLPRVSMFGDDFPFKRCGINEHVFRVRLKEPFCQAFLYYWLWSDAVMHELKHRGGKAAIPGINQADVKELKLIIPDESVLEKFDDLTAPLVGKIFANAKRAQTLTQLRDTILPRLISGQLRLPDAEAMLKRVES